MYVRMYVRMYVSMQVSGPMKKHPDRDNIVQRLKFESL